MKNLKYQNGKLEILDQRLLPNEAKWLPIGSKEAAWPWQPSGLHI